MFSCVQVLMISKRFTTSRHKRFAKMLPGTHKRRRTNGKRTTKMSQMYTKNTKFATRHCLDVTKCSLFTYNSRIALLPRTRTHCFLTRNRQYETEVRRKKNLSKELLPGRPGPEKAIWTTAPLTENDQFPAASFFQKFCVRVCPPLLETLWWLVWLGIH